MMSKAFTGQRALITGASSGIGEELAVALAARGVRTALVGRRQKELERVAERCRAAGAPSIVVPGDVSEPGFANEAVKATVDAFSGLDILVNNAGISMWARFDEIEDVSIFERLMKVNFLGAVYFTHAALPYVRESRGQLVAVSSLTGITGVPTRTAYSASKHAMQGFFDSLRVELRETGVNVLVVSPGFVDTPIREKVLGADGSEQGYRGRVSEEPMPLPVAVAQIVRAIERRDRELVMTARARVGRFLRLVAPGVVDGIAAKAVGDPGR
jgi:NAD(P)-dependent dehydrogenase (short-subunit alcohol dehydrogenase family)